MTGLHNSLFKELRMKKSHVLMGIASTLLMAALMFTSCPTEDDGNGAGPPIVTTPTVDQLPGLPTGATAVSNEAEAKALLEALEDSRVGRNLGDQVENVIENRMETTGTETNWKAEWNFEKDISEEGLKISSSGNVSRSTNNATGENRKKGDYDQTSDNQDFAVVVTADKTYGQVTLVTGSSIARAQSGTGRYEVTAVSGDNYTVKYSFSNQAAYGLGLTVTQSGKAGKIIFEASGKASASGTITSGGGEKMNPDITVSGSLKVYGSSNDTPVYSVPVTKENYEELFDYFGLNFSYLGTREEDSDPAP
jgi:hypothetical protein